jgi:hypothetical protein
VEHDDPGTEPPAIKVEVVDVISEEDEQIAFFRSAQLPDFKKRAGELGESLNEIASGLRGHLGELAKQRGDGWDLNEIALSFSLSLQASGGVVIIAQASASATFQATLTWHRVRPGE